MSPHTHPTDPGPLWVQRKIAMLRHKAETAPKLMIQSTPQSRDGRLALFADLYVKAWNICGLAVNYREGK